MTQRELKVRRNIILGGSALLALGLGIFLQKTFPGLKLGPIIMIAIGIGVVLFFRKDFKF